jgi:hypothetical protein
MSQYNPMDDVPDEALEIHDSRWNARGAQAAAVAPPPPDDLSAEIALAVARRPGEQVTCRRVGDHHYRCNGWTLQSTAMYDNPAMHGPLVTTSRISRSEFLHVTRAGRRIRVQTRTAKHRGLWFGA